MAKFISKETFSKTVQTKKEAEKTTPWPDLDKEEIYKVVLIEKKLSRYGECYLTSLLTKGGEKLKIFAPAGMIRRIRKERKQGESAYFMSLGQEILRLDKTKRNRYDLIFEEDSNTVGNLFVEDE